VYTLQTPAGRQRLRSATHQLMVVPRHRLSTVDRQAFAVQGQTVRNSLPDDFRSCTAGLCVLQTGLETLAVL